MAGFSLGLSRLTPLKTATAAPAVSALSASNGGKTFAGTTTANALVDVLRNGVTIETIRADGAGAVSYTFPNAPLTTDTIVFQGRVASSGLAGTAAAPASYLGQVATNCHPPTTFNTSSKQFMARKRHIALSAITSIQIGVPNWYVNGAENASYTGAETGLGASASITASIEYPVGTFTQAKFGGSATGTAANLTTLISDAISVTIPAGATFFTRIWFSNAVGIVYRQCQSTTGPVRDDSRGDAFAFATTTTDLTMGGTITSNSPGLSGFGAGPLLLIAQTTAPSVYICGDSRAQGQGDTRDATTEVGLIERSIGGSLAYVSGSTEGVSLVQFLASNARQIEAAGYCSHVVLQLSINDLRNSSRTAAQVQADLQTARALFGSKPVFLATSPPAEASFTTANAQNVILNDAIRAGISGFAGYFELADVLETARNSKAWVGPYTADNLHGSPGGYIAVARSGAINPARFAR